MGTHENRAACLEVAADLEALVARLPDDPRKTTARLVELRDRLRAHYRSIQFVGLLGDLDDLIAFMAVEGIDPAARKRYAECRLKKEPVDPAGLDPAADFVAFRNLGSNLDNPDPDSTKPLRDFLDQFPDSPKAEAAHLRLTRYRIRLGRRQCRDRGHSPGLRPPTSAATSASGSPASIPSTKNNARNALAEFRDRYPETVYGSDLALLEAGIEIDCRNWSRALDLLTPILNDPDQCDLHIDAALNLGALFMQILDDNNARRDRQCPPRPARCPGQILEIRPRRHLRLPPPFPPRLAGGGMGGVTVTGASRSCAR